MHIFINIIVTFVLLFWPLMLMMSPMMLGGPGAVNDNGTIITIMLVLSYPIGLFLLLGMLGLNYFGFNGFGLAINSAVVIAVVFFIFGYFGLLYNTIRGISNSGYSIVDNTVYYDGKSVNVADSKTFIIFDNINRVSYAYYAKDKHHLYYAGKVVEGALAEELKEVEHSRHTYFRNSRQVFYDNKILQGAIADRFSAFEGVTGWACSNNDNEFNVYSYGAPLPAVDRDTFTPLNDFYAKDKDHIFKKEIAILPEADTTSFELMADHDFGKDKNHVYYIETKHPFVVKDADPASFEILDRGYARDRNYIFVIEQYTDVVKLQQAQVESFKVTAYDAVTRSEAQDINHYYYDGKIVGNRKSISDVIINK